MRRSRAAQPLIASLALGVFLGAAGALAQPEPPAPPSGPPLCSAPPASTPQAPSRAIQQRKSAEYIRKAQQAYTSRDFVQAIWHLRAAYLLAPHPEVLYDLAQSCREAGRDAEALALYERVLAESQSDSTREDCERHITMLRHRLAEQADRRATEQLRQREFTLAALSWEAAYQYTQHGLYLFQVAQALRLAGRTDEAVAAYQRFLSAHSESPLVPEATQYVARLRAGAADAQASLLFEAQRYDQAIPLWRSAFERSPEPVYLFRIADSYRLAGERGPARSGYERFLRETPRGELPELRQQAEERLRQFEQAELQARPARLPPAQEPRPIYRRWWFWTALGAAAASAVAIGVTAGLATRPPAFFADVAPENQRTLTPQ